MRRQVFYCDKCCAGEQEVVVTTYRVYIGQRKSAIMFAPRPVFFEFDLCSRCSGFSLQARLDAMTPFEAKEFLIANGYCCYDDFKGVE